MRNVDFLVQAGGRRGAGADRTTRRIGAIALLAVAALLGAPATGAAARQSAGTGAGGTAPRITFAPTEISATGDTAIEVTLEPQGTAIAAFTLAFKVDPASVRLVSLLPGSGVTSSGDAGGPVFSFGAAFASDLTAPLAVGTINVQGLQAGAELILDQQVYTFGDLTETIIDTDVVAAVVPGGAVDTPTPITQPPATSTPVTQPPATSTPATQPSATRTHTPTATPTITGGPPSGDCIGDCDGSGDVSLGEVQTSLDIFFEDAAVSRCPAADANGNGEVSLGEVQTSLNNFFEDCPVPGMPTAVPRTPTVAVATPSVAPGTPTVVPATPNGSEVIIDIGDVTVDVDEIGIVPVTLRVPAGADVIAVQLDFSFDAGAPVLSTKSGEPDCVVNPLIDKNGSAFDYTPFGCTFLQDCTGVRAVIISFTNVDPIPNGSELFDCVVWSQASSGLYDLLCDPFRVIAQDSAANSVDAVCESGRVIVR